MKKNSRFAGFYMGLIFFLMYLPIAIVGCYAFMTIRLQDTSIFDFIQYACAFFIFHQQFYIWSYTSPKTVNQSITNKRKNKFLRMWR